MANGDDQLVNQNTDPIDYSLVPKTAVINGKVVDVHSTLQEGQKKPGVNVPASSVLVGNSWTAEGLEQEYQKTYEQLRKAAVEEKYDGWGTAAWKFINGTVMHAGAALEEFIGTITDPADWRITTSDLTPPDWLWKGLVSREGQDDDDYRNDIVEPILEEYRPIVAENLTNAFKYLDDHTIFGDGDEFGNWWTRRAAQAREESAIYNTVNTRSNWINTVLNYGSQIGGSIAGNVLGPGGFLKVGKIGNAFIGGLKGLNATQQAVRATAAANTAFGQTKQVLNTVAGAFMMSETTGFSIAQEVYNKTYEKKLFDLSPNLKTAADAAYSKALDDAIISGKSIEDATMAAVRAKKEYVEKFANENPDLRRSAVKSAGKGAEVAVQAMAPSFLLNLTMSSAFTRAFSGVPRVTRNVIRKSPYSARGILFEGGQEWIEEWGFENIAEDMGMAAGEGRDYTLSDAYKTLTSWESIIGGGIGFFVGGGMKLGTDYFASGQHKIDYEKQQEFIRQQNEIGSSIGQPDFVEQLTAPIRSAEKLKEVLHEVNVLQSQGKDEEAKMASKKILAIQAFDAYKSGTTKNLINNWQKIANDGTLKPEVREAANTAIREIKTMETDYNESAKYANASEVFQNRINQRQNNKLAQDLNNKINEKKIEAQAEVALLKQTGKLDLTYDEDVQEETKIEWNSDGTIKEVITPTTKVKKDLDLELTSKGYVSTIDGQPATKQINQIYNEVKPYQEFLDLQEQLEATEIRIAEANADYAKMTDKNLQKNLKLQNMALQEYQAVAADLEEFFGTDKYMEELDSKVFNYYKQRMDKKSFDNFRERFKIKNDAERATREIAEKVQLEDGLKETAKPKEETEEPKTREIPFTKLPKESKIELVARKIQDGSPLSAEEEQFKNSNSIRVENKRIQIEKENQNDSTPDSKNLIEENVDEGTTTVEKGNLTKDLKNAVNVVPNAELSKIKVETKLTKVLNNAKLKVDKQQAIELEEELNKENPSVNIVGTILEVNKSTANQIISEYKLNEEAVESNTDVELINYINDIEKEIEFLGGNELQRELPIEYVEDEFGEEQIVYTEEAKKELELIKRLKALKNPNLTVVQNKTAPYIYKFQIPFSNDPNEENDAYAEKQFKSYEPKELSDNLSSETKNQIKNIIGDYVLQLEDELGALPSFEKFLRDYIVNSSKAEADTLFNSLVLGWELNAFPVENYQEVYEKVFKNRKNLAKSLLELSQQEEVFQKDSPKKELNKITTQANTTNIPVETASGEMIFKPELFGKSVFQLSFNSTSLGAKFIQVENEEGELETILEKYEEDVEDDNILKHKKLLRTDKYQPGTKLSVEKLPADKLAKVFIKDRSANGQILVQPNGSPVLIEFGQWVAKTLEGKTPEQKAKFLKSQTYYDAIPLVAKDSDGDFIAYIPDITKISSNNELSAEEKQTKIRDLRAVRKYIIDSNNKGLTPQIEITSKSGGKDLGEYSSPQTIRNINNKAILTTGIVNNSGELTHVYVSNGSETEVITLSEFEEKYNVQNLNNKSIYNSLKFGGVYELRTWEGNVNQLYYTKNSLSEEVVDSIMNMFELALRQESNSERQKVLRNLNTKLKIPTNDNSFIAYINKFIRLKDSSKVKQDGQFFIDLKNFNKQIVFGIKGEKPNVVTRDNFDQYKDIIRQQLLTQESLIKNKYSNPGSINLDNEKIALIEENGDLLESSYNYFEYMSKNATTVFKMQNIGTADNPHFISRIQPNIEFKPIAPPNRNSNNYTEPKIETNEENKQSTNLAASTYTDEQLKKELPNLEAQGFEFIGDTVDEKVADIKKLLSENTNESTELAKQLDENLKEKLEQKSENNKEKSTKVILQTNEPTLETIDNVTFGTANKQGSSDNNEDALYIDIENGVFVLADGMGGESSAVSSAANASKDTINLLLGNKVKTDYDKIVEIAEKYTIQQVDEFMSELENLGLTSSIPMLNINIENFFIDLKLGKDLINKRGSSTGATALKATRIKDNTYEIEKVGDTVYFVVDKNGNVTQAHGLSNVATTNGYIFSVKNGKPFIQKPPIDKFTVTLNEGETLVLATDFIETEKAMQEFIASDFGKNLNFEKFQKSNKKDDSTFIAIEYTFDSSKKPKSKTEETATPLKGFEEFFNIFAESSSVDEAIQKLIDNKTITKVCK